MRRVLAISVALVIVASAGDSLATPTSRLTYVRGPGAQTCPDEPELRRAVAERLGYDPFFPWASRTIVAQIERKLDGYAAELKILDPTGVSLGERALPTTHDCAEIVRSLALAISIAIDDLETAAPSPPAPAEAPADPAPATAPTESSLPERRPVSLRPELAPPKPSLGLAAELAPHLAVGTAPAAAVGGSAGLRLDGAWWSLGLEARLDLPAADASPGGGRIETTLALGTASACLSAGAHATWRPFVCALGSLGSFHATSTDVSGPRAESARYFGAGARLGSQLSFSPLFYGFGRVDALGSFTPHRAFLNGEVVFTLPVVSGDVAFGVGMRIL